MQDTTNEFFKIMRELYHENQTLQHFARRSSDGESFSTNPVTAFILHFFIYNSIYQVDWTLSSKEEHHLTYHASEKNETEPQKSLEEFIVNREQSPEMFLKSFQPLLDISLKNGDWMLITEDKPVWADDKRISKEKGSQFFENMRHLQTIVKKSDGYNATRILDLVGQCRNYVYKVRCNIFHGRKTLLEVNDQNQKKRIEIYLLFLSCLLDWFFSVTAVELDIDEIED